MKIILLVLVIASLTNSVFAKPMGTILGSIPTPGPCITGLTWDGQHLWAADHKRDIIYKLDQKTGKILKQLSSPSYRPAGLAWDGKKLWNVDPSAKKIYRLVVNKGVGDLVVDTPVSNANALAWDGRYLWIASTRKKKLLRLDPFDGTTIRAFKAPVKSISGMAFDGKYLWITDRIKDQLHLVHPASNEVLLSIKAPGPHSTGIAFDGKQIWVADYQTDRIYRLVHFGDRKPLQKASKYEQVEFTHQLRNLGPGKLISADIYLAIPQSGLSQKLFGSPQFNPAPKKILKDQWGQQIAHFHFNKVTAGKFATVTMKVKATLYDLKHQVLPHQVKRLSAIPAKIRKLYLKDGAKYSIFHPTIKRAVKKAVGKEKNPYWIARKIYRYVHQQISYKLAGGWNVAPRILARRNGSCSEYSFVFIAMCRAAGIPARYVGSLVVRKDDASYDDIFHRWAEIYLPDYGWIPIDASRGDKSQEVLRGDAFGHLEPVFLITTRGGGGSRYLSWKYNSDERWVCKGRCQVEVETIAEWSPWKGKFAQ